MSTSNIVYIPSSAADKLTKALWSLTDMNPTRGTTGLFRVVEALDKSIWMMVDTEFSIPVHTQAELTAISGILQPLIDAKVLASDTLTVLQTKLDTSRGKRIRIFEAFPPEIQAAAMTEKQLIDAGRLTNSSLT